MIELPDANSYGAVADWIEIHLATTADFISRAELSSILEGLTGEEIPESFLSSVWNELINRQNRYVNPPFTVSEQRICKASAPHGNEYIACLIFSLFGASSERLSGTKLFERLSALVLKEYLQGEVFIFGWPVLDGMETAIGRRILDVSSKLKERFAESPRSPYKDRGVDIIAWKSFAEGRSSQCVILAQCAAGKDWCNKTRDLPLESWSQYIHWACDPVTAFFVPCIIPDDSWHDISREAGILFDRIRIINLLPNGITDPVLSNELREWTEMQLAESSLS